MNVKMLKEMEKLKKLPDSEINFSDIPEKTNWENSERGKFYRFLVVKTIDFEGGELPRTSAPGSCDIAGHSNPHPRYGSCVNWQPTTESR